MYSGPIIRADNVTYSGFPPMARSQNTIRKESRVHDLLLPYADRGYFLHMVPGRK